MTDLGAHGIAVKLPSGWEGRVFRRPGAGELSAAAADGPPAPPGETTHAVMHVSTIALPPGVGDFASGAVDQLGANDALVVLFEYDPASANTPLFAAAGIPRQLDSSAYSTGVLQRGIKGQAGAQLFFNEAGRAFCLYVVLGSYANRNNIVPAVNQVLSTLTIDPSASPGASSATTTEPPTTSTGPTTTTSPSTTQPGSAPGSTVPAPPATPTTTTTTTPGPTNP